MVLNLCLPTQDLLARYQNQIIARLLGQWEKRGICSNSKSAIIISTSVFDHTFPPPPLTAFNMTGNLKKKQDKVYNGPRVILLNENLWWKVLKIAKLGLIS